MTRKPSRTRPALTDRRDNKPPGNSKAAKRQILHKKKNRNLTKTPNDELKKVKQSRYRPGVAQRVPES